MHLERYHLPHSSLHTTPVTPQQMYTPQKMSTPVTPQQMYTPQKMSTPVTPQQMSTPVWFDSPLLTPVREVHEVMVASPQQISTLQQTRPSSKSSKATRHLVLQEEHLLAVQLGDRLNYIHITAAQQLIQREFPVLDGFQNLLLSFGFAPIIGEGVQIHNIRNQWVTTQAPVGTLHSMTAYTVTSSPQTYRTS